MRIKNRKKSAQITSNNEASTIVEWRMLVVHVYPLGSEKNQRFVISAGHNKYTCIDLKLHVHTNLKKTVFCIDLLILLKFPTLSCYCLHIIRYNTPAIQ